MGSFESQSKFAATSIEGTPKESYFTQGEEVSIFDSLSGKPQSGLIVERVDVAGKKVYISKNIEGKILHQSAPLFETFIFNKPQGQERFSVFQWLLLWRKVGGILLQDENPLPGKVGGDRTFTPAEARDYFRDKPTEYDEARAKGNNFALDGVHLRQAKLRNAYFGREIPPELLEWEKLM